MKIDILLSCMNQKDACILDNSGILGDAVVVNQCGTYGARIFSTAYGTVRWIDSGRTGLSVSRNTAIAASDADVCLLCDDDEVFMPDYREKISRAYQILPQADVIIFKIPGWGHYPNRVMPLRFPKTMHAASWQISFRRRRILNAGIRFDELLGAGTGNGAEEELKFMRDCEAAGLKIYYVPWEIAEVNHRESTWFSGFDETFFYNRGATTRYILGFPTAAAYAVYYVIRKRPLYRRTITPWQALKAAFRGIRDDKISKQAKKIQSAERMHG